jgi:flap endonuclease-1
VKKGEFAKKIAEKCPDFDPEPVLNLFLRPPVTTDYTLVWGHPDAEKIKKMLCDGYDFAEERVESALERYTVKSGQKTLESFF